MNQAFVGCYEGGTWNDPNDRALETLIISSWNGLTAERCLAACQILGYKLAGILVIFFKSSVADPDFAIGEAAEALGEGGTPTSDTDDFRRRRVQK